MMIMDNDLIEKRLSVLVLIAFYIFSFLACTSRPEMRLPPEQVMHYPFTMALNNQTLMVSATSADGKYDFGRLVTINTDSIKRAIDNHDNSNPIDWKAIVTGNVLIPKWAGEISFSSDFLVFSDAENQEIISLPVTNGRM
jgi:hypothetical protein